jgi:amidase
MCRTVTDAALLLGAGLGIDPADPATAASRGHTEPDYTRFLERGALRGARIGVMRKHLGISAKTERVYDEAVKALASAGAVLVDPVDFADPGKLGDAEWQVLAHEFKAGIGAYLATLGPDTPYRTVADLIAFNEAHRDREMPWFGQETFEMAAKTGSLTSSRYRTLLATCRRLARTEGLDARLAGRRLDAIVAATGGPAWPIDLVNGDRFTGGSSTWAAVAGYPSVTVPMGGVDGLPVGLSFMGRAWSEGRLLGLAYAFEQATLARKAPQFRTTVE